MSDPRPPFDDRFPTGPPLNGCAGCRRDFASLAAFDLHFDKFDGRVACGDVEGWLQDKRGRWTTQKLLSQARKLRRHHSPDIPSETSPETPPETSPDTPSES
jgi:hypothetical protein